MSLPHTGIFEAKAGVWTIRFDGDNWTGSGQGFEEHILPRLVRKTPYYQHTHSTCETVATNVLDYLFPAGWTKTYSRSDTWEHEMPPGMKD